MKKFEIYFGVLRLPVDFVMTFLALLASYEIRRSDFVLQFLEPVDLNFVQAYQSFTNYSLVLAVIMLLILMSFGMYSLRTTDTLGAQIKKVFMASGIWLMIIVTYFFVQRSFPFSRAVILSSTLMVAFFVSFGRICVNGIQRFLLKRGAGVRDVILIGNNNALLTQIYASLNRDYRFNVRGYVSSVKAPVSIPSKLKLGNFSDLENIFKRRKFDDVIHIGKFKDEVNNEELLNLCKIYHRDYQFVPQVFELQRTNILLSNVAGFPLFRLKRTSLDGWGRVFKRVFDIVVSLILLIVLSPVFIVSAIGIKLTSKGPVFFRKDDQGRVIMRVGHEGRLFCCLKFRTMKINTHSQRYDQLAKNNIRKNDPLVKIKGDPRITSFGKLLRRFDIDELPQLWNVLVGDMSLVGPRPHLEEEVDKYQEHHRFVFTIKPGITGLAQVSGRSDLNFEDEVRLDSYYIENWSIWMDVKILLRTIFVVLKGHGENEV